MPTYDLRLYLYLYLGWAPSSFVSSRKQRAQRNDQRVEDFMDDEDIALQAEDRRLVAKDTFAGQSAIERVQSTRKAIEDATANSG
jgi:G patch domain-containing protein 1